MSSSTHIDNKKKNILVLGKGHTLTAKKKMYLINFTVTKKKKLVRACISMKQIVIYLLMAQKLLNLKQKILRLLQPPSCLGNISKDWSVNNMKKTGFTGYIYDFIVDYNAIAVDDIKDIHKYLMKKNNIV